MTFVVLLTGATGFVGRQVLRELMQEGVRVRVVVREGKQDQVASLPGIEGVVVTPDLFAESPSWWADVCAGVDIVVHAAWYAEPGKYLASAINLDCLTGTLALAKGAATAGVKRFIGIGTCAEYDLSNGKVSVSTPLKPATPYAAAKASAFMMLSQWLPLKEVEFAWCRLFYLYGEGEDPRRLVPYLHAQLGAGKPAELSSGQQVRDFLDIRAAGKRIVEIAIGKKQGPVNICSGIPTTVREIAERIADGYGRRDLLRFGVRADTVGEPPYVVGLE